MSDERYVFDTNTLVSALLLAGSRPSQALRRALQTGRVLLSPATAEELVEVLQREKFERYVTPLERKEFLVALLQRAVLVEPTEGIRACRDASDDKFLELAIAGGASYSVSGDRDLLALHPFRNVAIVTPAEFLQAIDQEPPDADA